MAHLLPSDITKLDLSDPQNPEHETLAILNTGLTDHFTVFHSVHWSRSYEKYTIFGEIDFVIVNQSGDVLIIEQKNGKLEETDQGLVKRYGNEGKSVVGQINRSLKQIRDKYQFQHGKSVEPRYFYLLYCPDHQVRNLNAAGLDEACIVDSARAGELCSVVKATLGTGEMDAHQHKRVVEFFAQSYHLVLDIHARQIGLNKRYKKLASNLVDIVSNLDLVPYRLRISGTAGSGKSLVAADFYSRQIARGSRVLFLCFNRPLLDQLAESLPDGGVINTWFGFLQEILKDNGLDATPDGTNDFWDRRLDELIGLGASNSWQFDALVVDEGQDFEELWWMVLKENCLADDASVLWLEDPDQNVRGVDWQQREFPATFHARKNFRSPYRIAQFIQQTLPFEFEVSNGLRGLGVAEHTVHSDKDLRLLVDTLVKKWVAEGFGTADIVVLTCLGLNRSSLYLLDKLGNRSVRKFTGEYSPDGEQIYSEGELRFESVRRFKGQQAPVVILIDVDLIDSEKLADKQRVVFTGMTRATMRLEVVYTGNP